MGNGGITEAMIKMTMEKLSDIQRAWIKKCSKSINEQRDPFRELELKAKLSGYLQCLVDIGTINLAEQGILYRSYSKWV